MDEFTIEIEKQEQKDKENNKVLSVENIIKEKLIKETTSDISTSSSLNSNSSKKKERRANPFAQKGRNQLKQNKLNPITTIILTNVLNITVTLIFK